MSRRIKGEPSAETLRKRRYRARKQREENPIAFYLLRHKRKLGRLLPDLGEIDVSPIILILIIIFIQVVLLGNIADALQQSAPQE